MCFWKKKKNKETKEVEEDKPAVTEQVKTENQPKEEKKVKKETKKEDKANKKEAKADKKDNKKSKPKEEVKMEKEVKKEEKEDKKVEDKQSKKPVYRVVFDKEDKLWKIKKDGAARVIDSRKTKEEALARVQELSGNQDVKFVVYKKDGKFQNKDNLKLKKSK